LPPKTVVERSRKKILDSPVVSVLRFLPFDNWIGPAMLTLNSYFLEAENFQVFG
jgi:hypothetical protein